MNSPPKASKTASQLRQGNAPRGLPGLATSARPPGTQSASIVAQKQASQVKCRSTQEMPRSGDDVVSKQTLHSTAAGLPATHACIPWLTAFSRDRSRRGPASPAASA